MHYLALHDDGQLPPARSSTAAWARLPPPPYCDADARPRTLPEVHVEQAASSCVGTPVASRRHAGVTPAVKLVPAIHEPMIGTHGTSVPRRQFYDEAVEFVTQLLRQHQPVEQLGKSGINAAVCDGVLYLCPICLQQRLVAARLEPVGAPTKAVVDALLWMLDGVSLTERLRSDALRRQRGGRTDEQAACAACHRRRLRRVGGSCAAGAHQQVPPS